MAKAADSVAGQVRSDRHAGEDALQSPDGVVGAPVSLESILCTDELHGRPSRPPDYETENRALVALGKALANSPHTILQTLADTILEVTHSESAGLSLLTTHDGGKRFYWPAIAGRWKPHIGGGTPRDFGPCGDVLDRNMPLLFRHFELRYKYFQRVTPPVEECLLVPFYVEGKAVGTIWAIAHDDHRKFDREDERIMISLGTLASSAYQILASLDGLKFQEGERQRVEGALRRSEANFRDFVETASVGLHWVGPDGIVLWVNQGQLDLLGYTSEEYVGRKISEFHADQPVISDMLARLIRGETFQEYQARLRCKDGSIRHVLIDSSGLFEDGKFLHTRCFIRDITQHKLAAKRLATQYAITRVLGESNGLLEAAPKLIRAVCETADWEIGTLWGVDKTAGQLRCLEFVNCSPKEFPGFEAATRRRTFSLRIGLPGRVWSNGEPAWVQDVTQDGNFPRAPMAVQDGLRGAFAFPVRAGNQILGVMEFLSAEVRQPEPELIELLIGFGNQIGQFAERTRAEEALRASEQWFREMIDAIPAAIYTTDAEGRLTHFNPAAVEFSGRVPELGTDQWCVTWKLFRADGTPLPHDECPMAVALKQGRLVDGAETIAERPDGRQIWFVPYPRLLRDTEGNIVGGINMLIDISERKHAERATGALAAIVDSSDDAIISKSLDGVITSWNKSAVRMFGYTAEEAVGKHIVLIVPPHLRDEEAMIFRRLRRGERVEHFETVRMRKDGTMFDISVTISPVKDASGRIVGASKVARDITERKQAEEMLRQSHANLERVVKQRTSVLRTLYTSLLRAQDDERRRVARELHDSVGQYLASLKMNLTRLDGSGQQPPPPQVLSDCLQAVDECISETRTISHLLHPPLLDEAGFSSAARWYVDGFAERSGIQTKLSLPPDLDRLPSSIELTLFRILQESLTNIHRHSGSPAAEIHLAVESDRVVLTVKDCGCGIAPERLERFRNTGTNGGVGLGGMRERIVELDGNLQVESDGQGTVLTATIPLKSPVSMASVQSSAA